MGIDEIRVGVVGYCPPTKFDEVEARKMVIDAYNKVQEVFQFGNVFITIVSGLTNVGVLKIAYEEATKRRWGTAGVACERALEHELFPVDEKIIVGENWGDESPTFINSIDAIIRIGGGKQSLHETEIIKSQGKMSFEYDLPALE